MPAETTAAPRRPGFLDARYRVEASIRSAWPFVRVIVVLLVSAAIQLVWPWKVPDVLGVADPSATAASDAAQILGAVLAIVIAVLLVAYEAIGKATGGNGLRPLLRDPEFIDLIQFHLGTVLLLVLGPPVLDGGDWGAETNAAYYGLLLFSSALITLPIFIVRIIGSSSVRRHALSVRGQITFLRAQSFHARAPRSLTLEPLVVALDHPVHEYAELVRRLLRDGEMSVANQLLVDLANHFNDLIRKATTAQEVRSILTGLGHVYRSSAAQALRTRSEGHVLLVGQLYRDLEKTLSDAHLSWETVADMAEDLEAIVTETLEAGMEDAVGFLLFAAEELLERLSSADVAHIEGDQEHFWNRVADDPIEIAEKVANAARLGGNVGLMCRGVRSMEQLTRTVLDSPRPEPFRRRVVGRCYGTILSCLEKAAEQGIAGDFEEGLGGDQYTLETMLEAEGDWAKYMVSRSCFLAVRLIEGGLLRASHVSALGTLGRTCAEHAPSKPLAEEAAVLFARTMANICGKLRVRTSPTLKRIGQTMAAEIDHFESYATQKAPSATWLRDELRALREQCGGLPDEADTEGAKWPKRPDAGPPSGGPTGATVAP